MKRLVLIAIVFVCLGSSTTEARNLSAVDGNMLLTKCHSAEQMTETSPKLSGQEWSDAFYCLGFVQGAMDADAIWHAALAKGGGGKATSLLLYCVPNDASWPQLIRVLVKWLEENPEKLNLPGYDIIQLAMSKSYPCTVVH